MSCPLLRSRSHVLTVRKVFRLRPSRRQGRRPGSTAHRTSSRSPPRPSCPPGGPPSRSGPARRGAPLAERIQAQAAPWFGRWVSGSLPGVGEVDRGGPAGPRWWRRSKRGQVSDGEAPAAVTPTARPEGRRTAEDLPPAHPHRPRGRPRPPRQVPPGRGLPRSCLDRHLQVRPSQHRGPQRQAQGTPP